MVFTLHLTAVVTIALALRNFFGSGSGIRTPIIGSKGQGPTIERIPNDYSNIKWTESYGKYPILPSHYLRRTRSENFDEKYKIIWLRRQVSTLQPSLYQSDALPIELLLSVSRKWTLEPQEGFEPPTRSLQKSRSTTELSGLMQYVSVCRYFLCCSGLIYVAPNVPPRVRLASCVSLLRQV